mmetsp:Transcript_17263/g.32686  ORF Transcript_17263/g.32686 Transcript_17263/m.32686 type:complete len:198 (+) Transcript_17263:1435-2028(+)
MKYMYSKPKRNGASKLCLLSTLFFMQPSCCNSAFFPGAVPSLSSVRSRTRTLIKTSISNRSIGSGIHTTNSSICPASPPFHSTTINNNIITNHPQRLSIFYFHQNYGSTRLYGKRGGGSSDGKSKDNKKSSRISSNKSNLPEKVCVVCNRPFTWRKKWERCWDEVTCCSKSCNAKRRGNTAASRKDVDGTGGDMYDD